MEKYIVHVTYNNDLSFSEFNKIFDNINKSFNDINRDNGVKNNKMISEMNPKITKFREGSIILELAVNFIVAVSVNLVSNAIIRRFSGESKINAEIRVITNNDGSNEVDIHLNN